MKIIALAVLALTLVGCVVAEPVPVYRGGYRGSYHHQQPGYYQYPGAYGYGPRSYYR